MSFDIQGRIKGDKEVVRALNKAPHIFNRAIVDWLKNERASMIGLKDAKGRQRKGYRDILAGKKLAKGRTDRGRSTWSRKITHLFNGYVPYDEKDINKLYLRMGLLSRSRHQFIRALEMLATGGSITSGRAMIVPMYNNLMRINYTGPWSVGSVKTGLQNKAFGYFMMQNKLITIKKGQRLYFFNRQAVLGGRWRKAGFKKENLLFMGLLGVRVRRQLSGRYDFYARWDRILPSALNRGQGAVDKATKRVERVK